MKLCRNDVWKVLDQDCANFSDPLKNMAASAEDSLTLDLWEKHILINSSESTEAN